MPMPTKEAQREYQRRWIAKRRSDWFADKKCVKCGSTENLELDHIDPSLKVSHNIWSWAIPRRDSEISKCQVLCHECHKTKTLTHDIERAQHGSNSMYRRGCRCQPCRNDHAVVNALYR